MYRLLASLAILICSLACINAAGVPQQVRLSFGSSNTEMVVTFVVLNPQSPTPPFVRYGLTNGNLNMTANPYSTTNSYGVGTFSWSAGVIYRVRLTGLTVGIDYFYQVVDQAGSTSVFSFETWSDSSNWDTNGGVIGQQGYGGTGSIEALIMNVVSNLQPTENAHFMLHAGNTARANGNSSIWDAYGNMIQPVSSLMPFMITPGFDDVNRLTFPDDPYLNRWTMPYGPESNYYYKFRVGQFQVIVLDTEEDYRVGSAQYTWLETQLISANNNRALAPWIVVSMGRPMYSAGATTQGDPVGHALIRESFEKLFHQYGVDIVFQAGIFSYERNFPVYGGVVGYIGSGTQIDPYVNPQTLYFSVGTASSKTDDIWLNPLPSYSNIRIKANGVCEFHSFHENTTFSLHFNEFTERDVVWATKSPAVGCPNGCSGNGICSPIFFKCVCRDNYYGHDCSVFYKDQHLVNLFDTNWRWMNSTPTDPNWMNTTYDDSNWTIAAAPFGIGSRQNYFSLNFPTNLGGTGLGDFFFRNTFVPQFPTTGNWTFSISLYVSSDGGSDVYLNGVKILSDLTANHALRYFNDIVTVNPSLINWGQPNYLAAQLRNTLGDAFFDVRLSMRLTCGPMWTGDNCDVAPVLTTVLITSGLITTSPLTTSPLSTGSVTSSQVTSSQVTSGAVTSGVTSRSLTSISMTSGRATTGPNDNNNQSPSDSGKKSGLSGGVIAAIIIVAIVLVAVVIVVAVFVVRKNKRAKDASLINPDEAFQMETKS